MNPHPAEPMIEKDPIDDREEFVKRVKSICNWKSDIFVDDLLEHLVMNNEEELIKIRKKKVKCEKEVEKYLAAYDKAASREERADVVGKVKKVEME